LIAELRRGADRATLVDDVQRRFPKDPSLRVRRVALDHRPSTVVKPCSGPFTSWNMYTVYIDESGHSGKAPFADATQPVHVLAGVWFSDALLFEHERQFRARKIRHNCQMRDVKGARLVASAPGRRFLADLFADLAGDEVPAFVTLVHKAFMIAGVLVEDATDYVYNSRFPLRWTQPIEEKFDLMNWVAAHLPDHLGLQYWNARASESALAFRMTALRCLDALQIASHRNARLVEDMRAADWNGVWEMARQQDAHTMKGYSANLTAFTRFLDGADRLSESLGSPCRLVHDAQAEFGAAFKFIADINIHAKKDPATPPYMRLPTEWIRSLEFQDSAESVGLQIADCIAAAVRTVALDSQSPIRSSLRKFMHVCHQQLPPFIFGPYGWASNTLLALAEAD
jgi:hypothetical protein